MLAEVTYMSDKDEVLAILQRYGYRGIESGEDKEKSKDNSQKLKGHLATQASYKLFLQYCKEYYKEHGHLLIPLREIVVQKREYREPIKYNLGRKLYTVRRIVNGIKEGEVPNKLVEELDAMDPNWRKGNMDNAYQKFLDSCIDFFDRHGHLRVPREEVIFLNDNGAQEQYPLGAKIVRERRVFQGKLYGTSLPDEIVQKLNEMDPDWSLQEREYQNKLFIKLCINYYKEHGHLRISNKELATVEYKNGKTGTFPLGQKMANLRYVERGTVKGDSLPEEMLKILDCMDLNWRKTEEEISNERFLRYCTDFYNRYGHLRIPRTAANMPKEKLKQCIITILYPNGATEEYDLGAKMYYYRTIDSRKGKPLPDEIVQKLNEMDPDWSLQEREYQNKLFINLCANYYRKHGHLRIPSKELVAVEYKNGKTDTFPLGQRMVNLRCVERGTAKGDSLPEEMLKMLDCMDLNWKKTEEEISNERFLRYCTDFYNRHGHLRIPRTRANMPEETLKQCIITILYFNGVIEEYDLGAKMYYYRYIDSQKGKPLPDEIVQKLNEMDPYWVNREVSIKDMQKEKVQRENIKSQTRA